LKGKKSNCMLDNVDARETNRVDEYYSFPRLTDK
jgi:hypothetical protein